MIEVDRISVRVGDFQLRDISFTVPSGCYGVLMGRTGSGKTTVLEAIIGFRRVQQGSIRLAERDVTRATPAVRGVGYVPQDGALFPTMTVADQMEMALVVRRVPAPQRVQRVRELAGLLGIEHLLERKPRGLSGGERQRVALGRALSFQPGILCLDEPLSALDEETREQMYELLGRIKQQTGVTALHVTHHPEEARRLGDCWFQIRDGQVVSRRLEPPASAGFDDFPSSGSDRAPA